ncbi:MAG: hypothetical protein FJW39_24250 [Acidobacteria bacterium]|nr:hypothetical protein [Acidobacteriota bacterium]
MPTTRRACQQCNFRKGPNLSAIDPATGQGVRLFDPRRDRWDQHFILKDGRIEGLTPVGRATSELLGMNAPRRIEFRRLASRSRYGRP